MLRYPFILVVALASSQAPGVKFASVVVADAHSCGITVDGDAYCWGDNESGQLGDGTKKDQFAPVAVTGGLKFKQIVLDGRPSNRELNPFTCGLTRDGRAYCWGKNALNQLGDGSTRDRQVPTPVTGGLTFTELATSVASTCGITPEANVHCWGAVGATPFPGSKVMAVAKPIEVTPFGSTKPVRFIDDAFGDPCALGENGAAYCWATEPGTSQLRIAAVTPPKEAFQSLALGSLKRTCGVKTNGELLCWSEAGNRLTLSLGAMSGRTPPPAGFGRFQVLAYGTQFKQVQRNGDLCAVTVDGQAMCLTREAELKEPLGDSPPPKLTAEATNLKFTRLEVRNSDHCGLTAAGELYCWQPSAEPVRLGADLTFANVSWAQDSDAACGLTPGGDVYCWGSNRDGQVGDGTKTARTQPVPIKMR